MALCSSQTYIKGSTAQSVLKFLTMFVEVMIMRAQLKILVFIWWNQAAFSVLGWYIASGVSRIKFNDVYTSNYSLQSACTRLTIAVQSLCFFAWSEAACTMPSRKAPESLSGLYFSSFLTSIATSVFIKYVENFLSWDYEEVSSAHRKAAKRKYYYKK